MFKNVAIVGSGALATFYGVKLAQYFNVSILGSWPDGLAALQEKATVVEEFGVVETCDLNVALDWKELEIPDVVFWLTKTYKNTAAQLRFNALGWRCPIVIVQNGLPNKKWMDNFPNEVFVGSTTQGAKLIAPGKAQNTGNGVLLLESAPVLMEGFKPWLNADFKILLGDLELELLADIETVLLRKLSLNAVINPTAYWFEVLNGGVVEGDAFSFLLKLIDACYPYFEARGIYKDKIAYIEHVKYIATATENNVNSMLADKRNNQPTEIRAFLEAIIEETPSDFLREVMNTIELKRI